MIFDTHCHLNDDSLYVQIDEVINRAKAAGVAYFLVVGWDKVSSYRAVEIAEKYPCCYASVGYHPCNINDVSDEEFDEVMALLKKDKVVALGEIGLDYHWVKEDKEKEKQKAWFIRQIEAANQYHKPVIIHNRDSNQDCLTLLSVHHPLYGGVVHCYSGSVEMLPAIWDLGLFISLGGPVTFTNAKTPKEVAKMVPLDHLLLETDCPYLSPHPLRGTVNEPKNITLTLSEIARLKGMKAEEVEEATLENALKCFRIPL